MKICYLYLDKAGTIDKVLAKYQSCVSETVWWRRHGVPSPDFFLLCLICSQRMLQTKGQVPVLNQAKCSLELWLWLSLVRILTPRLVLAVNFIVKPTLELQSTSARLFFQYAMCRETSYQLLPDAQFFHHQISLVGLQPLPGLWPWGEGLILSLFLSHGTSRAVPVAAHFCCPSCGGCVS